MQKPTFLVLLVLSFLTCINVAALAQSSESILGEWLNEDKDAKVMIYKDGKKFYGKVSWLLEPKEEDGTPKVDDNNPDKSKRSQPIMGLVLLKDFVFDDDRWKNGTIYDPKNGKTYKCYMELESNDVLKIRGYIGQAWMGLGRTTIWTR